MQDSQLWNENKTQKYVITLSRSQKLNLEYDLQLEINYILHTIQVNTTMMQGVALKNNSKNTFPHCTGKQQ